jgi:hypothetical protein
MVQTCSHLYPSGKTCGRIPRRGESLCHDHRRLSTADPRADQEAFDQDIYREIDRLALLSLDKVIGEAQEHLRPVEMFVEKKAPRWVQSRLIKAGSAITLVWECILNQPYVLTAAIPGLTPDQVKAIVGILWFTGRQLAPQPAEAALPSPALHP